ncbi:HoxN/HupN/NixA family nickel/cobalt transporter [Dermacoccus sp. 147Ba]|nr:HoxN/HupN/NixA family nickel/cobalt transporter [Dermacoccus sp. PAMC28757]RYI21929.1 HoxN/HupN/NixA family nickel/cobalt transporter [Dermacoccus sp. 147Ba]
MLRFRTVTREATVSKLPTWWKGFNAAERRSILGMTAFVALLHVLGWGVLALIVAPQNLHLGTDGRGQVFGIGLGITAYTLGMRHAFDADHIAAIDNTTRKLLNDGRDRKPVSVGFWFSLGHSSVVFTMCLLLALGVKAIAGPVADDDSSLHRWLGIFGPTVSGSFLWLIGILNLVSLIGIVRVWRRARRGHLDEVALEEYLNGRGFFARFFRGATKSITKPAQMYPLGFLFGLGFDTATEVSLLVLAGGAAAFALPWYAILTLPVIFAAGMSLLDAADGVFMTRAYDWAFAKPLRRLYYNVTVTGLSVVVALVIGTIELASVVSDKWGITSGPVAWLGAIPLDEVGYVIVGLFVVTWLLAVAVWRLARIDERELGVNG